MAKKNLKSALASHNLKKAQKAHEEKVQAAQARKADSVKASASGNASKKRQQAMKKRKLTGEAGDDAEVAEGAEGQIKRMDKGKKRSVDPFQKDDTILLVGEGKQGEALLVMRLLGRLTFPASRPRFPLYAQVTSPSPSPFFRPLTPTHQTASSRHPSTASPPVSPSTLSLPPTSPRSAPSALQAWTSFGSMSMQGPCRATRPYASGPSGQAG